MFGLVEVLFGLLTVAFLIVRYYKWRFGYWKRRDVPYVEPAIPWGTDDNPFDRTTPFNFVIKRHYDQLRSQGHPIGGLYLGSRPALLLLDPEVVKKIITKDFHLFSGHGLHIRKRSPPLFHNLFSMDGEEWRKSRAKLTPTFTTGKMKMMFPTILACVQPMIDHISGIQEQGKTLDIKEVVARFTTDVIGSCAFGVDCDCFKNPNSEFRKHGRMMLSGSGNLNLKRLILSELFELGLLPMTNGMMQFFDDTFKSIFQYRTEKEVKRNDFVELLLEMQRKDSDLTVDQMSAHSFMFFLAGFETSSTTLTFLLFELSYNLDVQDKLRREIKDVLERHDGKVTYDAIMEMKYMQMVIDETLRKYPPGSVMNRACNTTYKIEETGTVIEKGTLVLVSVLGIHRNPEYYPDPQKFDPERFTKENKSQRHPYTYIPFGEGPRICLGLRFALMQVKIGLSYLLTNFAFTPHESMRYDMAYHLNDIVLAFKEDVILNVEKVK